MNQLTTEALYQGNTSMASPPEVLLEPEDNDAFQAMLRALTQMKRGLSFKVGKPHTPLEDMHVAKSLQNLLGDSPSQARVALVAAQGQVTREGLLKAIHALDEKAFETVSAFESFASKIEDNSEESVDGKRKEILGGIEDYRACVQLAIEKLEALTAFTAPVQSGHAPSPGGA